MSTATHSAQLATAKDAGSDNSIICQCHLRAVGNIGCQGIGKCYRRKCSNINCRTGTAAKDATEGVHHLVFSSDNLRTDCAARDIDFCTQSFTAYHVITSYSAKLTTTIDVTLDSTSSDGQLRTLHVTEM